MDEGSTRMTGRASAWTVGGWGFGVDALASGRSTLDLGDGAAGRLVPPQPAWATDRQAAIIKPIQRRGIGMILLSRRGAEV
jgi:hypothetical protein